MPHPFIESCYKGMYLTYVRYCKFTNPNVHQGQLFMAQCVVELFGIDLNVAYEVLRYPTALQLFAFLAQRKRLWSAHHVPTT